MEERAYISNIKKKDLLKNLNNYLWLEIEQDNYKNINFAVLLEFIDKYVCYGKGYPYGNAYYAIRKKANELFGIRRYAPVKLKISKHEIRAILHSIKGKISGRTYLKISYKISYIFKAIILIVDEIEKKEKVKLPKELEATVNFTYGVVFFEKFIEVYDGYYGRFKDKAIDNAGYRLKMELSNDFHSEASVFNNLVN